MLTLHIQAEGNRFVARCLELEVTGTGRTKQEAFEALCDCIILSNGARKKAKSPDEAMRLVLASPKDHVKWFGKEQLSQHAVE